MQQTDNCNRSGTRVKTVVDHFEPCLEYMGVDLCRGQVGMAEHQLNRAKVRSTLQEMCRKRVPQHVRADCAADPGAPAMRLEDLPEPHARQRTAPRVDEDA